MSELPNGWEKATLEDCAVLNPRHQSISPRTTVSFVPMPAVSDVNGEIESAHDRPFSEVSKGYTHFQSGDVIFAKITPCMENGKIAVARKLTNGLACGSTEFHVLRPLGDISPDFIWRFLRQKSFRADAEGSMTGAVGQRRVPLDYLKTQILPLPPLNEQRRIVAKVDSLSAKSGRALERLNHIPRLVEKYKQAILNAAFSGALTRSSRNESETTKHDGSNKANINLSGFDRHLREASPDLPKRWNWKRLGEISEIIDPNPSHRYPTYENGAVPLLSTREFAGEDDWALVSASLVPRHVYDEQNARCAFNSSDIIFARKGRLGLARKPPPVSEYTFSHTIFVIKPRADIDQLFAIFYLRWKPSIDWLMREMNSNTGVPTLGKAILQMLPIAVPPVDEQRKIANRIEKAFTEVDRLSMEASAGCRLINHLDQTILAKAFRGELVPQAPNDEPASVLLDRIRTEREVNSPTGRLPAQKKRKAGS